MAISVGGAVARNGRGRGKEGRGYCKAGGGGNEDDLLSERGSWAAHPKMYFRGYETNINPYDPITNPKGCIKLSLADIIFNISTYLRYNSAPPATRADLVYSDYLGTRSLREVLAKNIFNRLAKREEAKWENIAVSAGAGAIVNHVLWVLGNPGDSVLLPSPYYNSFSFDIKARNDLNIESIERRPEDLFAISKAQLDAAYESAIKKGSKPRVLLLCSPDNPTGRVYKKREIATILEWCNSKPDLHLVSDELYAFSVFGESEFTSILEKVHEYPNLASKRTHIVWALSKDMGASGLRCGALFSKNTNLLRAMQNIGYFAAVPNPVQSALAYTLGDTTFLESYIAENKRRLLKRYTVLATMLSEQGIPFVEGEAGLFVWVNLQSLLEESTFEGERNLLLTLRDFGVWLAPGETFGTQEPGLFRICFAQVDKNTLRAGLQRLGDAFRQLKKPK
ncbi:hypothetical protein AAMO2058_001243000 [Amorphochlora amoebiformis]